MHLLCVNVPTVHTRASYTHMTRLLYSYAPPLLLRACYAMSGTDIALLICRCGGGGRSPCASTLPPSSPTSAPDSARRPAT
eukprot:466308-Rhodomonas_salina.1